MYLKSLLILTLVIGSLTESKRQFPVREVSFLVDRQSSYNGFTMVTKKVYNQQKRYSANGTGKCNLKIVYQNGGNTTHTYNMIQNIETLLDSTRPHVLFMCENRMDEKTCSRLTNRHGFAIEEMGPPESRPKERIWAAIKSTVP